MFDLPHIFSQYELLELTAQNLSTLDLYHTALTCSTLYALIKTPDAKFQRLKRVNICDGKGLFVRQTQPIVKNWRTGYEGRPPAYDEEIEVRVFNLKCDERGALPCIKCSINVCEECRIVPRVKYTGRWICRRPHCNPTYEMENIMCFCERCDELVARGIEGEGREDYCQCNRYTRWICRKCAGMEESGAKWYREQRTRGTYEDPLDGGGVEDGMVLADHQHSRMYWCLCGVRAPRNGNIRCTWCRRKHLAEVEGGDGDGMGARTVGLVMEEDGEWQLGDDEDDDDA